MTDADLLAAVLAAPDDDTPRLAAADWLDEYAGDLPDPGLARDRSELIRAQCEAATPPSASASSARPASVVTRWSATSATCRCST